MLHPDAFRTILNATNWISSDSNLLTLGPQWSCACAMTTLAWVQIGAWKPLKCTVGYCVVHQRTSLILPYLQNICVSRHCVRIDFNSGRSASPFSHNYCWRAKELFSVRNIDVRSWNRPHCVLLDIRHDLKLNTIYTFNAEYEGKIGRWLSKNNAPKEIMCELVVATVEKLNKAGQREVLLLRG